jgi:hypothetical protein
MFCSIMNESMGIEDGTVTCTKGSPNILTMTKQGYDSTCSKYLCDVSVCVCVMWLGVGCSVLLYSWQQHNIFLLTCGIMLYAVLCE